MGYRIWRRNGLVLPIEGKRGFFDTSYGEPEAQKLDVQLPGGEEPLPVIISIHGGDFVACDKRQKDMTAPVLKGLRKGFVVATLNYGLVDEAAFPESVKDIRQAIRFLKTNVSVYRPKPDQMAAWGDSIGGYMALVTCLFVDDPYYDQELDPNLHVSAQIAEGVAWYPLTGMASCDEELAINSVVNRHFHKEVTGVCMEYEPTAPMTLESEFPFYNREGWLTRFLGCPADSGDETVRKASPSYVVHDRMPSVLIQHGSSDETVPMRQSIQFVLYANTCCGGECITVEISPNAVHSSVLFEVEENLERVFAFISDVLGIRKSTAE